MHLSKTSACTCKILGGSKYNPAVDPPKTGDDAVRVDLLLTEAEEGGTVFDKKRPSRSRAVNLPCSRCFWTIFSPPMAVILSFFSSKKRILSAVVFSMTLQAPISVLPNN
jgi:hypothetical protein